MSTNGADDLMVQSRTALLDALEALRAHSDSVVVVGAQAVYLHTGEADVALAEATKDSDLALDPRSLGIDPLIEDAMKQAGFLPEPDSNQPGTWVSAAGIPVDLMVPEALNAGKGRRGAKVPPHDPRSMRRAVGLEAAVVDNSVMNIPSLAKGDDRVGQARVAGPAALLVAKLHKLADRRNDAARLHDKDAHDIYRLLVACTALQFADALELLLADAMAGAVTEQALISFEEMFARSAAALGCVMAGRAELGIGDPDVVAASTNALAQDVINLVRQRNTQL